MGTQTAVAPKGSAEAASQSNPVLSFVPMVVVIAILYFMIIRPQQKQTKEHRKMVDNLKAGDRVLTQGGIYGTVASLKAGIVQVKIAENLRVDVARSAITQVLQDAPNGSATPAAV